MRKFFTLLTAFFTAFSIHGATAAERLSLEALQAKQACLSSCDFLGQLILSFKKSTLILQFGFYYQNKMTFFVAMIG